MQLLIGFVIGVMATVFTLATIAVYMDSKDKTPHP